MILSGYPAYGSEQPTVPYTIPFIDVAGEIDRQVIVAQGTKTEYRGQVNTVLMKDGHTIFAVWSIGHGGKCGLMKKSEDGGLTWIDMLPTPQNWLTVKSCPCIFRLTDTSGVERMFVIAGNPKLYQSMSLDEGKTWTPMKWNGLYKPGGNTTIIPVEGGHKHLMHVQHKSHKKQSRYTVWQAISSDGGLTWDDYREVCGVPDADPCEPCLVRSPNGRQLLCLMRENSSVYDNRLNSLMMTSDDEGKTWSKAKEVTGSLTGHRHVAAYAPDSRLVVAFRDMAKNSPNWGCYVAWIGTYDDIISGREGQYRFKILHQAAANFDCGYSGLECLPDGTMVVTTYVKYGPGPEKNSIVSVRFKLDEIDEKAKQMN